MKILMHKKLFAFNNFIFQHNKKKQILFKKKCFQVEILSDATKLRILTAHVQKSFHKWKKKYGKTFIRIMFENILWNFAIMNAK